MSAFVTALTGGPKPTFEELCAGRDAQALLGDLLALERFRAGTDNLYQKVGACAYAAAICRLHLQDAADLIHGEGLDQEAWHRWIAADHEGAILRLWTLLGDGAGATRQRVSQLGQAYHLLQYQTLGRQVRASVRASRGNTWLFRGGHAAEHPLRIQRRMLGVEQGLYPVLREETPVRLDLSHSGWSDIFFLAMERPQGARVVNLSVDLAMPGADDRHGEPTSPITCCLRVIDEPVVRLTSIDLGETTDVATIEQLFDFGADHLGLLKAAVVASGLIPPATEGTHQGLADVLGSVVGRGERQARGIELVTSVNGIPKGSRLAVSTNLLASAIALMMRATGQTQSMEGPLDEDERRIVASRAILGEWLGGSGGGWQDSGGIWPGIKLICGEAAKPGDPEHGVSTGCLLPRHRILELDDHARTALEGSLVAFHGGMSGNVGPILELVTGKHLLRLALADAARQELEGLYDEIIAALAEGDCRRLGGLTQRQFDGPLQAIIPAVNNAYTQTLIDRARAAFGEGFWGFAMLGGMSGGGMSMFVNPAIRERVMAEWPKILRETAAAFKDRMPFATEPKVYRVRLSGLGTVAAFKAGAAANLPRGYYHIHAPLLIRARAQALDPRRRTDLLNHIGTLDGDSASTTRLLGELVANLLPSSGGQSPATTWSRAIATLKQDYGHDAAWQARLQAELRGGGIGIARNRLPGFATLAEVPADAVRRTGTANAAQRAAAADLLRQGAVAVVTLAGGVGSRWTGGAGVVKALFPLGRFAGAYRSFVELHLRKSALAGQRFGARPHHVLTASFLTHPPISAQVAAWRTSDPALVEGVHVSAGQAVAQRVVPMVRDLELLFQQPRPRLDEQKEKARQERDRAWIAWAKGHEGEVYADNLPGQVLNPPGHWWELPSALLNGTIARIVAERPAVRHLLLHNLDTLGAELDEAHLAEHLASGAVMTVEVVPRLAGDAGGALAQVDRHVRLVEGLAMPSEEAELGLAWYNSNTCWIDLDRWLASMGLNRNELNDRAKVAVAVRAAAARVPTYVTIKEVKRRWGHGQEDVLPVAQFEQLWGDTTALTDLPCAYLAVDRRRGQQLKDIAQLDGWMLDGSRDHVARICGLG